MLSEVARLEDQAQASTLSIHFTHRANPVTSLPPLPPTAGSPPQACTKKKPRPHTVRPNTCDTTTAEEPTGKKWHEWAASLRETGSKEKNKRGLGLANDSNVQRAGCGATVRF